MPFLAKSQLHISTKDILSWCYDNRRNFDQDKPIYIDCANPSQSISANQAYRLIRKLAAGFQAIGLRKGDVVDIHAFNSLYYPLLVQGIIAAGGIFVGTNPSYTPFELDHALKISKAKIIIAEPELLKAPLEVASKLGVTSERILLLAEPDESRKHGYASWRTLLDHGERDWIRFDDLETAKNTPAFLMFSSGTTGLPKAAMQSHYNIIAEHTLVHENPECPEPYHLSRLCAMPMFHTAIGPYVFASTLRSGRESYVMKRFAVMDFIEYHHQFQVTNAMMVPPMVLAVLQAAEKDEAWVRKCLRSIKAIILGAAPLDPVSQSKLKSLLSPDATCTQLWAMTETSCIASYFYYPQSDETGSIGRFVPNLDVKLTDPDADSNGKEVAAYDTRGEICIRGPTVIRGYLDNPEANARDWDEEGYFHTGDIAYCDSKTKLFYIVDRKKELIKVRGFQVAPNEIEGVLLLHPKIKDVAVIGIADAKTKSELPRAYVVAEADSGSSLKEEQVKQWVMGRLARYKELSGGVRFVDSLPRSASGKLLKRQLREEAKREQESVDRARL